MDVSGTPCGPLAVMGDPFQRGGGGGGGGGYLPFAVVGTLNGVHLFSRLRGATLHSTVTRGAKVVWRTYHDSVVLLVVTCDDGASDDHLGFLLDNVFGAMVMSVGLDAVQAIRNVDRLKRDLRGCYPLVDHLLSQLDQDSCTLGDLTGVADFLLCPESQALQPYLESFVEEVDSLYGCLLVRGKVAVATKHWLRLSPQETVLLAMAAHAGTKCISRDLPVYLPNSCPTVCNRLVTLQLTQGVELCLLCGPAPSLAVLEEEKVVAFPPLDKNILGFLLINTKRHKSLTSVHPLEDEIARTKEGKCISLRRRQEMLRVLYKSVVGRHFPVSPYQEQPAVSGGADHSATEVYTCAETHKSYAIRTADHQLYLLFSPSIPTFAMSSSFWGQVVDGN
ncbi:hypothetical protein HPB47_003623 [Ixodes persulcatus]|uniref:Uncharacterized protein n=1 Tax=Ixodes persulcatus TaxID=34615 RepID=A0AC60PHY3_IXOPE|nr:hypothetical protein HPB47_003623 [Ixodes persulcatus]